MKTHGVHKNYKYAHSTYQDSIMTDRSLYYPLLFAINYATNFNLWRSQSMESIYGGPTSID